MNTQTQTSNPLWRLPEFSLARLHIHKDSPAYSLGIGDNPKRINWGGDGETSKETLSLVLAVRFCHHPSPVTEPLPKWHLRAQRM